MSGEDTGRVRRTAQPQIQMWIESVVVLQLCSISQLGFTTNPPQVYIIFFRLCHMREFIDNGVALGLK